MERQKYYVLIVDDYNNEIQYFDSFLTMEEAKSILEEEYLKLAETELATSKPWSYISGYIMTGNIKVADVEVKPKILLVNDVE